MHASQGSPLCIRMHLPAATWTAACLCCSWSARCSCWSWGSARRTWSGWAPSGQTGPPRERPEWGRRSRPWRGRFRRRGSWAERKAASGLRGRRSNRQIHCCHLAQELADNEAKIGMLLVLLVILVKRKPSNGRISIVFASYILCEWCPFFWVYQKRLVINSPLATPKRQLTPLTLYMFASISRVHEQAFPVHALFHSPFEVCAQSNARYGDCDGRKSRCLGLNNVEGEIWLSILRFCKTDCDMFDYYENDSFSVTICILTENKHDNFLHSCHSCDICWSL